MHFQIVNFFLKDNQIEELNKLCDDLMRKNCVIDEENVSVADSFDDFQ